MTLKQELELAKIEEIQKASIVQILDKPFLPLGPINKNVKQSITIDLYLVYFWEYFLQYLLTMLKLIMKIYVLKL